MERLFIARCYGDSEFGFRVNEFIYRDGQATQWSEPGTDKPFELEKWDILQINERGDRAVVRRKGEEYITHEVAIIGHCIERN